MLVSLLHLYLVSHPHSQHVRLNAIRMQFSTRLTGGECVYVRMYDKKRGERQGMGRREREGGEKERKEEEHIQGSTAVV